MINDSETGSQPYKLQVEHSLGLMCIHDLNGVLLSVNPAAAASLGYPPEAGPGRNLSDFLVPEVRPLFGEYLGRIRRDGKDSGLLRLQSGDGSERIWMYRNTVYAPEGSAPVVLGHALDITERVRAERALKEAKAELARMNDELARLVDERTAELRDVNQRLRDEMEQRTQMEEELIRRRNLESLGVLAGGIAHDFNNFLTVVQGNVALARMLPAGGPPVEGILDEIAAACERASALTTQLLTFSKGGSPVRRVASVADTVRNAVNVSRAGATIDVSAGIAAGLWFAEIDPGQIGQVLHSVLLNAAQAMPAGGIVEVAATNVVAHDASGSAAEYVRITIRDYGTGIPADVLPRIFDPYFTTKPRCTGLGLTSAYSIVQKHGGRISVESQPGQGTLVTIDLPALPQAVVEPSPPQTIGPTAGGARLLVMDDEEGIRKLLKSVLAAFGHEVTCARDGAEAVALYEAAKAAGQGYDAVLLDLTVKGGMGGIDAAARLKETDASAKLIVSSGYSESPVLSDFRAYGFDDMLLKPWTPDHVGEVFGRVLAGRRAGKQP
jgi:PAS domain S-box-containing protein